MTLHPRENRGIAPTRRHVLQLVGLAGLAAAAGCGGRDRPSATASPRDELVLSRPDRPARLPLHPDVTAIADGLAAEKGGKLKILNYAEYLSPDLMKKFGDQHGVQLEVTTFTTQQEQIEKLRTAGAAFDLCFPTPDVVGRMVAGKLLKPLNHSYLTNLPNAWPQLRDPFYDQGSQYTVPYTAYTTGIGYRADRVKSAPSNGYDLLWDAANKGKVYILEDPRETLAMAMLRAGKTDVNTEDAATIQEAGAALESLVGAVNVKVGISAYQLVPEGQASVHQCWSGDMINAQYYLPEGVGAEVLGYWYPADEKGVVGTDCMAVPATAQKPVLAHMFMNILLGEEGGLENFSFTGYQPALSFVTPERMVADEYVAENLTSAIVTASQYASGLQLLQLSTEGEGLWNDAFAKFRAGS
ncbi:MAG TPA: spermidine/putrescine ABC transporter substrate-binding protein [Micromonosporaceae bacterium]|nr:spermidine/putrescine ABC transporter substrate-binding protein [Micromonosporaceae bacterium]